MEDGGATRRCLFCGARGLTREHVFPQWLHRTMGIRGPVDYTVSGSALRTTKGLDVALRYVCETCNGGWLSELEADVQRTMRSAIHGRPVVLDLPGQRLVALWAAKTWMLAERALAPARGGGAVLSHEAHRYLYEHREPPADIQIWLGRVKMKSRSIVWSSTTVIGAPPAGGIISMLAVGELLFQFYVPFPPEAGQPVMRVGLKGRVAAGLQPIWPPQELVLRFPPSVAWDIDNLDEHWRNWIARVSPPDRAA